MRINWVKFLIVIGSLTAMAVGDKLQGGASWIIIVGAGLYAAGNAAIIFLMNPHKYGEDDNNVREQKEDRNGAGAQTSDTGSGSGN